MSQCVSTDKGHDKIIGVPRTMVSDTPYCHMVQIKREWLVLIPNIPSQALEPITIIKTSIAPFYELQTPYFSDEAPAGADNLSQKSLYHIASVAKSLLR